MNPFSLESPLVAVLFKWTCLLALGWAAHGILCRKQARWRLILWRGILCLGLALPLARLFKMPVLRIPIMVTAVDSNLPVSTVPPVQAADPAPAPATELPPQQTVPMAGGGNPVEAVADAGVPPENQPAITAPAPVPSHANSARVLTPSKPVPWADILLAVWAVGCVYGAFRLLRMHWQLFRLRKETCRPCLDLRRLALQIQVRLNASREVDVQISDAVTSPFMCGLFNPVIILPSALAHQLSEGELVALLSHEIAHLRQNDLAWCVAWRWVKAVCWFHPLVWKVPAVHNLACEQEADRIASLQLAEEDSYPRLLARLALRVLGLPAVETKLTLNGSSQIAWRLSHLYKRGTDAWNWKHSAAGLGLLALLFVMSAGFDFSKATSAALPVKLIASPRVSPAVPVVTEDDAPVTTPPGETSPQLTFELRDGSRVVGLCQKDTLFFRSPIVGNSKLKWAGIRSIEMASTNGDLARLTATNGDLFFVTLAPNAFRVRSAFGWSVLPATLIRSVKCAPPPAANAASGPGAPRLTIEMRDGSHVIGTSLDDILSFHSPAMGDLKLTWAAIRSIQDMRSLYGRTAQPIEMGRLTATNGDAYDIEFATAAVRVETSFGKTELPVRLIRDVKVLEVVNGGVSSSTNMADSEKAGSSSATTNGGVLKEL